MDVTVKVVNISNNKLPEYQHNSDAGVDVRADFSRLTPEQPIKAFGNCQFIFKSKEHPIAYLILDPGCRALIPTGIFTAIPAGYEIQVRPRSGLALKKGISLVNTPGTIDSNYRSEIGVILINHGLEPVVIEDGERIAQFVLNKVDHISWEEVESLDETERSGGFGSTGTK